MKFRKTGNKKASTRLLLVRHLAVPAFLFLYIFGTQFNNLHEWIHQFHGEELHSAQQEKNLCHRRIYHDEKDACEHKTHWVKYENCDLCMLHFSTDYYPNIFFEAKLKIKKVATVSFFENFTTQSFLFLLSSRAPPIVL